MRGGAAERVGSGTRPELDQFSSPSESEVIEIDDTTVQDEASERASSDGFDMIVCKREPRSVSQATTTETSDRSLALPRETLQRKDSTRSVSSSGRKRKRSVDNAADSTKNDSVRSKESATGVSERFQSFNVDRSVSPPGRAEFEAGIDVIDLEDDYWGDGAHLHWSPSPTRRTDVVDLPPSLPVSPGPAPDLEELDYDPQDMVGGEGILEFEPGSFAADSSAEDFELEESEESEEEVEVLEVPVVQVATIGTETTADRQARGMPNFGEMDLDVLQVGTGATDQERDVLADVGRVTLSTESRGPLRIPQEQSQGNNDPSARAMLDRAQSFEGPGQGKQGGSQGEKDPCNCGEAKDYESKDGFSCTERLVRRNSLGGARRRPQDPKKEGKGDQTASDDGGRALSSLSGHAR